MDEKPWQCVCGETDITKHDLGMVIAHEYEMTEQEGRDILVRVRTRVGLETDPEDRVVASS